jgi:hypothetical protein
MIRPSSWLVAVLAIGCHNAPPAPAASPIAGTYQTSVSLTSSSCTGVTVQNNPTTVAHTSGATAFSLTHVGQVYAGSLASDDSFTTAPKSIPVGTTAHTLTIAGRFTGAGFVADVTAVVTGSTSCQYLVHWVGTK